MLKWERFQRGLCTKLGEVLEMGYSVHCGWCQWVQVRVMLPDMEREFHGDSCRSCDVWSRDRDRKEARGINVPTLLTHLLPDLLLVPPTG